jgi:hypothetical protein
VLSTACDSASITKLCQNGGISVLSSIRETERWGGWGMAVMLFLADNSPVKKEV